MAGVQSSEQVDTAGAYLKAYGRMMLVREFELAIQRLFLRSEVHGTTHLYTGQEAVAVGVCMALEGRLRRRHLPRPRPRAGQGDPPSR